MTTNDPFRLVRPCLHCPFRSDGEPFLTPARVAALEQELTELSFWCHETVDYDAWEASEQETYATTGAEAHCAGALILLERLKRPSQMMQIAERLGIYHREQLDMTAPVYASWRAMQDAAER